MTKTSTGKKMKDFKLFKPLTEENQTISNRVKPGNEFNEFKLADIEQPVARRFEDAVEKYGQRIAVKTKEHEWTYTRLDEKANRLAREIMGQCGEEPGGVALLFDHGAPMIAGIFGVLKAGKYYIPLDPGYPVERLIYMLKDAGAKTVVTDGENRGKAEMLFNKAGEEMRKKMRLIDMDELDESLPGTKPVITISPDDRAYILYTSGSTGKPKGVLQNQRNVLHFARVYTNALHIHAGDRLTLFSSYSFDAAKMDIFGALLNGAALFPYNIKGEGNLLGLGHWLNEEKITIYHSIPTVYRYFTDMLRENDKEKYNQVRLIVLGGEAVFRKDIETFRRFFPESCIFINGLGPTESTVTLQYFLDKQTEVTGENVPVGYAVDQTQVLLIDEHNREATVFNRGEMVFKSNFLALGYVNNQEKTREVFVRDPLTGEGRVYRTGDLGKRLANGAIEYAGRKDFQVKVRGYRVEPGDVEAKLDREAGIKKSAVVCEQDHTGENVLVGYYITVDGKDVDEKSLAVRLKGVLPDFMVPTAFYRLDEFPLTATGKIDRNALEGKAKSLGRTGDGYEEPEEGMEKQLANIWAQLLKLERVGRNDHFFVLGANSLKAIMLTSLLHKELGVNIPLAALFNHPTIKELAAYIKKSAIEERYASIEPAEEKEYYVLSPAQKRMFILQQMEPQATHYNMPQVIALGPGIDKEKLEQIFLQLVNRHESLRTGFFMINDQPVQGIYRIGGKKGEGLFEIGGKECIFSMGYVEIGKGEENVEEIVQKEIKAFIRPFDLSEPPLLRARLMDAGGRGYILMVDQHHITTDGSSQIILIEEFMALANGQELASLRLQYKDYAEWQSHERQQEIIKKQEQYWLERLSGEIPVLDLPLDFPRPKIQQFTGNRLQFFIPGEQLRGLHGLVSREEATLYMVLLGLFNILLAKLCNQEEIIVGTPVVGRRHHDLRHIIGMFVNTLAIRNQPRGTLTFQEFLGNLKKETLDGFENQEYPFEDLVEKLAINRDVSRNPLFDVMFTLQNWLENRGEEQPGENENKGIYERGVAKFDLTFTAREQGDGLLLVIEYCTALSREKSIKRMAGYFQRLIVTATGTPGQMIKNMDILGEEEKYELVVTFNQTGKEFPGQQTIGSLLEEQKDKYRERIAVWKKGQGLSYGTLLQQADDLANELKEHGVSEGEIVALMMGRELEMIISILAIIRLGCIYMPVSPDNPRERSEWMLKDSEAKMILTMGEYAGVLTEMKNWRGEILMIEKERRIGKSLAQGGQLWPLVSPGAYIIYTSGTTGQPKGVLTTHTNVIRLVKETDYLELLPTDRVLQWSNIAFDGSVFDIFGALLNGGALVLVSEEENVGVERLAERIKQDGITVFFITTAMFNTLVDTNLECLKDTRKVLYGGERASVEHSRKALAYLGKGRLMNAYGPTETGVFATVYAIDELDKEADSIPIGKPVANTTAYILDAYFNPVPVQVVGELFIGGPGVARGYLNRPVLTAERFIKTGIEVLTQGMKGTGAGYFKDGVGEKVLYRTGDRVKRLGNGNIEFMGRVDRQVKIRGFRIELGEIETRLMELEIVNEAVVILKGERSEDKYLCAYVVCRSSGESKEKEVETRIRELLALKLPGYMIPAYIIELKAIPLTANGKVDTRGLPGPVIMKGDEYVAAVTDIEKELVLIWSGVLGIDREKVSVTANFFHLGGHSLKATVLVSQVQREFHIRVPLSELFKNPTVRELAGYIGEAKREAVGGVEPAEKREYYALSAAQQRIFILHQMQVNSTNYNMTQVVQTGISLDREKLEGVFKRLIGRHESLRTSFFMMDEQPAQRVHEGEIYFKVEYIYIEERVGMVEWIRGFIRPFELTKVPLLRVGIVRGARGGDWVVMDMHHLIGDGLSLEILEKEFYVLAGGGELAGLKIQYKDYVCWQGSRVERERVQRQANYWMERLAGGVPVLDLPYDYPRPPVQVFQGSRERIAMEPGLVMGLRQLAKKEGVTLFMLLLAIFQVLLSKLGGEEDVVVGTPVSGRRHADLEGVIGMFVNTLVLRGEPGENKTFQDFLQEVKTASLDAFENQEYPFEMLVESLVESRDVSRNPLFDVMFSYFERALGGVEMGEKGFQVGEEREESGEILPTAKFDLTLSVMDGGEGIFLVMNYCTKLFKRETVERMGRYFNQIGRLVVSEPGQRLGEMGMMSEGEKEQVLIAFNQTGVEYCWEKSIVEIFEEGVERCADRVGVVSEINAGEWKMMQLTYGEINGRADRIARRLREKGMGIDSIVGVMTERRVETVMVILGIMKSGAAYLPISPGYPVERIEYMLADSGAEILLLSEEGEVERGYGEYLMGMEEIGWKGYQPGGFLGREAIAGGNKEFKGKALRGRELVYIIYTSGTTGRPKGVMVEHGSVLNVTQWYGRVYGLAGGVRLLLMSDFTFDASVNQVWGTLTHGATLFIISGESLLEVEGLREYIEAWQIHILNFVPSYLDELLGYGVKLSSVKTVISGAESLSEGFKERMLARGYTLYNHYGPTEATIDALMGRCSQERVTLGKPVANVQCYILNAYYQPQPIGIAGELFIAGAGMARGYLNRPELTHERFIRLEKSFWESRTLFSKRVLAAGGIFYKSGDRVRWMASGEVEFLGRRDQQVKVRGFRVELGEIESRMLELPGVRNAVVMIRDLREMSQAVICGYVILEGGAGLDGEKIKEKLIEVLPGYMVPSFIGVLERMPMTLGGKVDRRLLPLPGEEEVEVIGSVQDSRERELALIWSELLGIGIERIRVTGDFFRMGGNSLMAVRLVARVHKEMGVRVPLVELFRRPTIRGMAGYIKQAKQEEQGDQEVQGDYTGIKAVEEREYYPLSSAQKRLYVLQQMSPGSTAYNMPQVIPIAMGLTVERLEEVFRQLIHRHESLRTFFIIVDREPVQRVEDGTGDFQVGYREGEWGEWVERVKGFIRPFVLAEAPLLRVEVLAVKSRGVLLLVDMHHIISDGRSMEVLRQDFFNLWVGRELPGLQLQYKDYAMWQLSMRESLQTRKQEKYWLERFREPVARLDFGVESVIDKSRESSQGERLRFWIGREEMEALKELAFSSGVTLYMVVIALVNVLLARVSEAERVVIGTPVAGRSHLDLQEIIGMFVNTLPLIHSPGLEKTFREFLEEVRVSTLEAFENQEYPFDDLVEKLGEKREGGRNPIFDVMVTFNAREGSEVNNADKVEAGAERLESRDREDRLPVIAKFDMTWNGSEEKNGINFVVEYRVALFSLETMERYIRFFKDIVSAVVREPGVKIGEIEISHGLVEVAVEEHEIEFDF